MTGSHAGLPIPAVELRGLSKSFNGVAANAGIYLRVAPGTIHAVIGENGAGKSTAMKILYGIYRPDAGEIRIRGESKKWSNPSDAIASGIGMVHQHFMLAGPYTALENIILGVERRALMPVDRRAVRARLDQVCDQYGLHKLNWDAPVESLPVGIQQRIEILKLLYRNASILILDEPTAVLTPQETLELFTNLKKLSKEGKTIIIITHKLKEVMNLADEVTVFRAGKVVGDRRVSETNVEDLANLMVGRRVKLKIEEPPESKLGKPVLEVKDLNLPPVLSGLNFTVRGGEVVGIAGVEGNGQSDLLKLLLHPRDYPAKTGRISILGTEDLPTDEIKKLGVGVIPEDRHREGLLLGRPVEENFLLGLQRRAPFAVHGAISTQVLRQAAARALDEYDVRPRSLEINAGNLSGGNQQKLIIAREFQREPRFLIAAQPTRGVDVGAIEFIHARILKARNEGAGVLLVSSELDEILALSDRILVMYGGRMVAEFARNQATEQVLGLAMGGAK